MPVKIKLEEYIREGGSNSYQAWFDGLEASAAAKVTVAKARLELGNTSNVKWFRGIGEYVIDWGRPWQHHGKERSYDAYP